MLNKTEMIIGNNTYETPKEKKRSLWDKLFLGSRIYFVLRYLLITLDMSNRAKKGKYNYNEFMEHSLKVLELVEEVGAKVQVEGIDNLKKVKDEPVIFIGNHMSALETQVLPIFILPIKKSTFVVKKSLLNFPLFGHVMRATKPIAVGRTNPREDFKTVMDEGTRLLSEGTSIIIFQQSHRHPSFEADKFSSLGIKLAQKAKVKIVPIALKTDFWGNARFIRDFGPIRRHEPVCFSFGTPIDSKEISKDTNGEIIEFIENKLKLWGHKPDNYKY